MPVVRWLCVALVAAACSKAKTDKPPAPTNNGSAAAVAKADDRFDSGSLGAITFELSQGTPEAKTAFLRGLLALHSFWYDEAERQFREAIRIDPKLNMAYWGLAMSRLKLLWGDDDLDAARTALSRIPDPEALSPREQAWVLATLALIKAPDVRSSRKVFAEAMAEVNAQFPDDESKTFLALALLSTTRPEDPDTIEVRKRAAALAMDVYKRNPKHPGAAHYIIHAFDTPELAAQALPIAREYAQIAPAAFHARHMPAHIFVRLGMWKDAITSCRSAWDASVAAAKREKLSADHDDFHSLSWLVEMPFELGRRSEADAALEQFADLVRAGLGHQNRSAYVTEVASYMARTGEWSRVDELLQPLEAKVVEDPDMAMGTMTGSSAHCGPGGSPLEQAERVAVLDTRALAAAMQHDVARTKDLVHQLESARAQLAPFMQRMQPPDVIAKLDAASARRRQMMLARAAGDDAKLVELLRAAAADTGADVGGESNPSAFVQEEELAEALARRGQLAAADAAFAKSLQQHPGRARTLLGAARLAVKQKDTAKAKARYQQLVELWKDAEPSTEGLAEATSFLSAHP